MPSDRDRIGLIILLLYIPYYLYGLSKKYISITNVFVKVQGVREDV